MQAARQASEDFTDVDDIPPPTPRGASPEPLWELPPSGRVEHPVDTQADQRCENQAAAQSRQSMSSLQSTSAVSPASRDRQPALPDKSAEIERVYHLRRAAFASLSMVVLLACDFWGLRLVCVAFAHFCVMLWFDLGGDWQSVGRAASSTVESSHCIVRTAKGECCNMKVRDETGTACRYPLDQQKIELGMPNGTISLDSKSSHSSNAA